MKRYVIIWLASWIGLLAFKTIQFSHTGIAFSVAVDSLMSALLVSALLTGVVYLAEGALPRKWFAEPDDQRNLGRRWILNGIGMILIGLILAGYFESQTAAIAVVIGVAWTVAGVWAYLFAARRGSQE